MILMTGEERGEPRESVQLCYRVGGDCPRVVSHHQQHQPRLPHQLPLLHTDHQQGEPSHIKCKNLSDLKLSVKYNISYFQNVITYLNFALAASVDVFVSSYVSAV